MLEVRAEELPTDPAVSVRDVAPNMTTPDDPCVQPAQTPRQTGGLRVVEQDDVAGDDMTLELLKVRGQHRTVVRVFSLTEGTAVAR